jgi:hypothetical protein
MPAESARGGKLTVPIARLPQPPPVPPVPAVAADEAEKFETSWLSVATIEGWVSSVVLHAILLLILAFWYFAPRRAPRKSLTPAWPGLR